ncbi:polyamine ABC transporter substrate-binding protein [bacterium]|nr:polyamine ABC transporter substrate-binding protein [bacterium]
MRLFRDSVLALAAIALSSLANAQKRVVNVYNWSDYISDAAIAQFQKQTGIKVVYDVYDSNEILSSKLLAGKSGYDVIFPSARPFAANHIKAKLYAPFNKALLPNLKSMDPNIMASFRDFDPQNQFVVPYMWGPTGLGINIKKVQAALGPNTPLDSWTLLFDPAIAAKLKGCGIAVLDDETEALGAALIYLGKPAKSGAKADLDAVAKLFATIRPNVRYFNSSRYIDDLANGDICLALGYSGDVLQARDRAAEAKNGQDIRFVIPKEGAIRNVDVIAIPKDASHMAEAHAFINFLMDPKVIAGITNEVRYPNGNKDATALLDASIRNDPGMYPPPATLAKMVDDVVPTATDQRARNRAWTKIKSGK